MFKFKVPLIPTVLVVIIVAGLAIFGIRQKPEILGLSKGLSAQEEEIQAEVARLKEEVGKLITLPSDEDPTVATVTEADKIKDQNFFKNAQDGDKVLIFTNEERAILYRPGEKKIVEVGAVNINQPDGVVDEVESLAGLRVTLFNGTEQTGLTSEIEEEINKIDTGIEVVARESAARTDYETTTMVVISPEVEDLALILADELGIEIMQAPEEEELPSNSDLLIIVGADRTK